MIGGRGRVMGGGLWMKVGRTDWMVGWQRWGREADETSFRLAESPEK